MKRSTRILASLFLAAAGWFAPAQSVGQTPRAPAFESYSRTSRDPAVNPRPAFRSKEAARRAAAPALMGAPQAVVNLGSGAYSSDIQHIVAACESDPKKLFDFVRNNVRFTPYFGFRKGADFTWLTRSGNDADQADLLVTLLHAAGFSSAQFEYGLLRIPLAQARAWIDADNDDALDQIIGSAGYYGAVDAGAGIFELEQVWVDVEIGGTTVRMHPAYKTFTTAPGINLAAAMGYSRPALLTTAGGTETANYVQGVDDDGITGYLNDRATSLINTIRASHPNASVDEIVGGRAIVQTEIMNLGEAFPSFVVTDDFTFDENAPYFSDFCDKLGVLIGIPDGFGGLDIVLAGISSYPTRTIGGRRISVTFDAASNRAQLWFDDTLITQEPLPVVAAPLAVELTAEHPYYSAGADRTELNDIERTGSYVIFNNPGGCDSPILAARRRALIDEYQRQGLPANSRQIITESLHLLAIDYMAQDERAANLASRIARFEPILHHSLAMMTQAEGFSVDIPVLTSYISRDFDQTKFHANVRTAALFGSAMEHGVIEQQYPSLNAVSTVRYARRNNLAGKKTYLATAASYPAIYSDPDFTAGWDSDFRDDVFPSLLSSGPWSLIIPEDGDQLIDQLAGNGYFQSKNGTAGAIINTGDYTLKGGFATTPAQVNPDESGYQIDPTEGPETHENAESEDPVDLFTGAAVHDHIDLALGDGRARGLLLARSYSSSARDSLSELGYGWNHSCRSFLRFRTDTGLALGAGAPEQAAAAITAIYVLNDLMRNEHTNAKGWVVSSITSGWLMNQVWQNAVDVTVGRKNYTFTWHPDFTSFVPSAGVTARLIQDEFTGEYRIEERFGGTTAFDLFNRITSFTDADGKTLNYAYVSGGANDGKIQTVTDCYGRTLTFNYYGAGASQGFLQSVADSTGRSVSYTYAGGYLATVTDPENHVTHFDYDANGRLWTVLNALNETVAEHIYDEHGRVCQQVAEADPAQTWQFAFTGLRNVQIDPLGHRTTLLYDEKGRQTAMIDALGHRTTTVYDGQDHVVSITDPENHTTGYQYDGRHNVRFVTNANGHTTEMVYDAQDRLDYVLDALGKKTDYAYDAEHHLTEVKDQLLRTTTYQFYASGPSDGLVHHIIEPGGDTTTFTYDANGHPDTITRPDGSVVEVTCNARGDMTYSKITTPGDPNLHESTMAHDKRRLLLSASDALNFSIVNGYDARGRLVSQTDRFGNLTAQTESAWGRRKTATMPNGATAVFNLDAAGRRDQTTNALGQVTQFAFDAADRVQTVTDALNQPVTYGYDDADNRSSLTNARGKTWGWIHTPANLVDTLTSPLGRVWDSGYNSRELIETLKEPSLQETTFLYHDDQRLQQTTDPLGTVAYAYDGKGRLDTVTEGAAVLDRDYDSLNRLTKFTDSAGNVIEYTYDGAGNLRTLKYPGDKTVTYTYDAADRLDFVTDWAGRVTDFQYDQNSRLTFIVFPNGTQRRLTYDGAGRISRIRDEVVATLATICQAEFAYDALDRVVKETGTPEAAPFTVLPAAMTHDDDDRLLSWNGQSCASDADGNLTTGPLGGSLGTFTYDARNRLTSAGAATYAYDAENRRTSKTESGVTTSYLHDPQAALSRLLVRTKGGDTTRYVHAAGMLLYEEKESVTRTYHTDYRGSTLALTDDAAAVTDRITYGAYGETVARTGTSDTPFLFHGAHGVETDSNGLCLMRARYYSVETRRFLNADPIGFDGGNNWYAFVSGNPVSRSDPLGLWGANEAHGDWMNIAANGFSEGGLLGALKVAVGTLGMSVIDGWDARQLEDNAGKSGAAAGRGCPGKAIGYGALVVGQTALSAFGGGAAARGARAAKTTASGAESALQGAQLNRHLSQLEKYGAAGSRTLENGRIRYYGKIDPARTPGEMAGRRLVREWDPSSNATRTWHETVDRAGSVRQVRPETGGPKVHYRFDANGNYIGSW